MGVSLQQEQHEDGSAIQSLKNDCKSTSQTTSRLQDDLQKESSARAALEATARNSADTAEHALKVSEEARSITQGLEDTIKERLQVLENKVSKTSLESLKKLSVPERILYFQNVHKQPAGLKDESPALADGRSSLKKDNGSGKATAVKHFAT